MKITVCVSVCLSKDVDIEVPNDQEYDPIVLEHYVREQIKLPQDYIYEEGDSWSVDDVCVM